MLLPMAKIMLEMIPLSFEHIVVFILTLPARARGSDNSRHRVCFNRVQGHEGIVIELFAIGFPQNRHVTPINRQGRLTIASGNAINVSVLSPFIIATIPIPFLATVHFIVGFQEL